MGKPLKVKKNIVRDDKGRVSIVFDDEERKKFLSGMHCRKDKARKAILEADKKIRREDHLALKQRQKAKPLPVFEPEPDLNVLQMGKVECEATFGGATTVVVSDLSLDEMFGAGQTSSLNEIGNNNNSKKRKQMEDEDDDGNDDDDDHDDGGGNSRAKEARAKEKLKQQGLKFLSKMARVVDNRQNGARHQADAESDEEEEDYGAKQRKKFQQAPKGMDDNDGETKRRLSSKNKKQKGEKKFKDLSHMTPAERYREKTKEIATAIRRNLTQKRNNKRKGGGGGGKRKRLGGHNNRDGGGGGGGGGKKGGGGGGGKKGRK